MERVTIRDVTDVCPAASVAGSADLRDTALAIAPRVAPPGSPRPRVAEVAAALILVGVGEDPQGHGLAVDGDILARAADEHAALRAAAIPAEDRAASLERELAACEEHLGRARDEIERLNAEVAEARAEIERLRADAAAAPGESTEAKPADPPADPPAEARKRRS